MANVCPHCQKGFIRPEHLRRHVRSVHDEQGTTFRCGECGKTFSRADSCRRHQLTHREETDSAFAMARGGERVRRACRNCANARTKCSGGDICSRCRARNLTCVYSNRPDRRHGGQNGVQSREHQLRPSLEAEDPAPPVAADFSVSPIIEEPAQVQSTNETAASAFGISSYANPELQVDVVDDSFNWNDSINWLPVADNVDFSLLFEVGLEPPAQEVWQPLSRNVEPQSPSSSDSSENDTSPGKASSLYADGRGGRRSLLTIPKSPQEDREDSDNTLTAPLQFPVRTGSLLTAQQTGPTLNSGAYCALVEHFHLLCTGQVTHGKPFKSTTFPTHDHMSRFLGLYVRWFHPDVPFIHRLTWWDHSAPWILILAAATIGASYDQEPDCFQTMAALREFLRRALRWHLEGNASSDPLPLAQASILHAISQLSNTAGTISSASRHDLELAIEFYEANAVLYSPDQIDLSQALLKWQAWIAQESHIRLTWAAWFVQALHTWTSTQTRRAALPDQHLKLPCESILWEAVTVDSWITSLSAMRPPKSLASALQTLFVRHQVPTPLDNFAEALLAYVALARTDEVARSAQQPLHAWSPAPAVDQSSEEDTAHLSDNAPIWLPANPRYAAWRNSACDALDVLHWRANGNVAMGQGSEGPVILHLHLVRLLLLCPHRDFMNLATQLKRRPQTANRELPTAAQLDESILRWLTMDDHKGRLSLVHAGALFWHLRRYARGHFYEPFSIYLATLTIWVYGVYLPQVRGNLLHIKQMNAAERAQRLRESGDQRPSGSSSEDEEDVLTPKNILLDRPCDDEMVQTFVRRGHTMQADMSGAPDICLSSSQRVVLQEGIKLLKRSQYKNLGQSQIYRSILQRLLQFT